MSGISCTLPVNFPDCTEVHGRNVLQTRQLRYVYRNTQARSCNHCCSRKAIILHILNVCVCVCVCVRVCVRYPARYAHAPYYLRAARLYNIFQHYRINGTVKKKIILHKVCFDFLYNYVCNIFILRRIQRDIIIYEHWSSYKVSVILVRFYWNWNFLDTFSKNTQISAFLKVRPV